MRIRIYLCLGFLFLLHFFLKNITLYGMGRNFRWRPPSPSSSPRDSCSSGRRTPCRRQAWLSASSFHTQWMDIYRWTCAFMRIRIYLCLGFLFLLHFFLKNITLYGMGRNFRKLQNHGVVLALGRHGLCYGESSAHLTLIYKHLSTFLELKWSGTLHDFC